MRSWLATYGVRGAGHGTRGAGPAQSPVRTGGRIVLGFALDRGYDIERVDADIATAGLVLEQRFATWDLVPFTDDAEFAVTFLRVP